MIGSAQYECWWWTPTTPINYRHRSPHALVSSLPVAVSSPNKHSTTTAQSLAFLSSPYKHIEKWKTIKDGTTSRGQNRNAILILSSYFFPSTSSAYFFPRHLLFEEFQDEKMRIMKLTLLPYYSNIILFIGISTRREIFRYVHIYQSNRLCMQSNIQADSDMLDAMLNWNFELCDIEQT